MTLELSIAVLGFSSIITAAIIKFVPGRSAHNGTYVRYREYSEFKTDIRDRLSGIEHELHDLNVFVRSSGK